MLRAQRLLTFVLGGLVVGVVAGTLIGSSLIPWYMEPGAGVASMCPCGETARQTVDRLVRTQLIASVIGGVVFLVLGIFLGRKKPEVKAAPLP